jgi:hypothetical protein
VPFFSEICDLVGHLELVETVGINGKQTGVGFMTDSRYKGWNEAAQVMETWSRRWRGSGTRDIDI